MKLRVADLEEFKKEIERRGIKEIAIAGKYETFEDYAKFYVIVSAFDGKIAIYYREDIGACLKYDEKKFKLLGEKSLKRENELREIFKDFHVIRGEYE